MLVMQWIFHAVFVSCHLAFILHNVIIFARVFSCSARYKRRKMFFDDIPPLDACRYPLLSMDRYQITYMAIRLLLTPLPFDYYSHHLLSPCRDFLMRHTFMHSKNIFWCFSNGNLRLYIAYETLFLSKAKVSAVHCPLFLFLFVRITFLWVFTFYAHFFFCDFKTVSIW